MTRSVQNDCLRHANHQDFDLQLCTAMRHALSIDAGDVFELKGRHGSEFLNMGAQAEQWIATAPVDGTWSHAMGKLYLGQLKALVGCDEEKYYASMIVLKDCIQRLEVASSCPEDCIEVTVTLALSGERIAIDNLRNMDRIYDLKQLLKLQKPLSKGYFYCIVHNEVVLQDSALVRDTLKRGSELQAVASLTDLLDEPTLEALFAQGVTCERAESLRKVEDNLWNVKPRGSAFMPSEVRNTSLKFMLCMAKEAKLAADAWFRMVTMFDLHCLRSKEPVKLNEVPLVCAAILRLVIKFDDQLQCLDDWIIAEVPKLSACLLDNGHIESQTSICLESVDRIEVDVIESLEWRLNLPTVFTWATLIMARYSVLTRRVQDAQLGWIWKHINAQMEFFVLSVDSSELTPRQVAVGLFFLGLVSANLMPVNIVFPAEVDEVKELFLSYQPKGAANLADVPKSRYNLLCELIETTIGDDAASLQTSCRVVAMAIQRIQQR